MIKNKLVSIVVPVYNSKESLMFCVDSLLKQTYKNIEIVLIDDGSTDESPILCDSLEEKYNNVRTYHKENGGLSSARNYGIEKSSGEYICFVDSDDYINYKMIEILMDSIYKNNSDISVCNFMDVYDYSNNQKNAEFDKISIENFSKFEALKMLTNLNVGFAPNVCNKIFNKKLFSNNLFPNGKLYEDMIVTTTAINNSNNISYINVPLYYYYQRKDSITKSYNLKEYDHIEMSMLVLKYIEKNCPKVKKYFLTYHVINCISVINKMILFDKLDMQIYKNSVKFIKKNKKSIFSDTNLNKKKKLQIKIFYKSLFIYSLIIKRCKNG